MVGSSEDGLRLRLRLSLVPGRTRLSSAEPSPLALAASAGTSALEGASSTSSTTSRRGRRPRHQVVAAMGVANNTNRFVSFAAPGYGESPVRYSNYAPRRLRPSGGYAGEEPGTVATAARRTVAASAGGGRPCRRSRPLWRGFFINQYTTQTESSSISSRSCCPWR